MNEKIDTSLVKAISRLLNLVIILVMIIFALLLALVLLIPKKHVNTGQGLESGTHILSSNPVSRENNTPETNFYWKAPDLSSLDADPEKQTILYGKELIANTAFYFGPRGTIFKSTNGMNCQNCHLEAGTKVFGNNYSAVASTYPKFRARSGSKEDIPKRVNDCFERSLNGKPLKTGSKEMGAIVAYINWLGKNVEKGSIPAGSGLKDITFLERPADPQKGKNIYVQKCQSCHGENGIGQINGDTTAYTFPPLWGNNSYNDGAGLFRLSNFAKYVKYNMPLGADHNNPILTDEEAWDVAAFVNSQPRPHKNTKKDWPDIEKKPFDHPFGPYADGFDELQHKYGPYQQIKNKPLR